MRIQFQAAVEYKKKIYLSAISINGLFVYDPSTDETRYLCSFKEYGYSTLHRMAFIHNNEAWFLPQYGRSIICVNLDTLEQTVYKIPEAEHLEESIMLYPEAVVCSGCVYATPRGIRDMAIIDMENHCLRFLNNFLEKCNDVISISGVRNNRIHYYTKNSNKSIVLDTDNETFFIDNNEEFNNCILNYLDEEVSFKSKNPEGECFINDEYINYKLKKDFSRIVRLKDRLIIFPSKESYLVIIDINSKKVEEIVLNEEIARRTESDIFLPIMGGDNTFFVSVFTGKIFRISENTLICNGIEISEREYEVAKMRSMPYRRNKDSMEYFEGELLLLKDFLDGIS